MREIGYETIGLFKHYAKVYMREIMERYLPLIYSNSIEYNPLINVDYEETFTRNIVGSGESSSESSSSNSASGLSVNSDTPQGQITKANILAGNYASNTGASETESSISDESSNTSSNTTDETYSKKVKGNSGVSATAQKMIEQYRNNIIAIALYAVVLTLSAINMYHFDRISFIGAMLFVISDSLIGLFLLLKKDDIVSQILIWGTYVPSELIIQSSLDFIIIIFVFRIKFAL